VLTYVAGEIGEHWYDTVVSNDRQVLLVASNARDSGTDASQHVDIVRPQQTHYQLQTSDETTHHLTRVLHTALKSQTTLHVGV